jgi:hypothetical protein
VIRNFDGDGIIFLPNSSNPSHLFVSNTLVSDSSDAILIEPLGSGTTIGVLNHVEMENNANNGLNIQTSSPIINVTVSDSVIANNGTNGIVAQASSVTENVMVRNSTITNNGLNGLLASGTGAAIRVTRSTITGNGTGWQDSVSGVVLSYGDNNIDGNTSVNTEPPGPLVYH